TAWDGVCVSEIPTYGCGDCSVPSGGTGFGGAGGEPDVGNCCTTHTGVSCTNDEVSACVCAYDSYCCEQKWDTLCVNEVESQNCGSCP
ncbi:MAG TPA: hypothetical protein VGP93_01985, partial [Polyangiaceae bacterium]|nr:hypothetical protein [Polyangiaceae bacterium]